VPQARDSADAAGTAGTLSGRERGGDLGCMDLGLQRRLGTSCAASTIPTTRRRRRRSSPPTRRRRRSWRLPRLIQSARRARP